MKIQYQLFNAVNRQILYVVQFDHMSIPLEDKMSFVTFLPVG